MNIDELLFRKAYATETLYLQQAWLAEKSKCFNERDKAFDKAAAARPIMDMSDVCTCHTGVCGVHWMMDSTLLQNRKCTCEPPPESPDEKCPFHGTGLDLI